MIVACPRRRLRRAGTCRASGVVEIVPKDSGDLVATYGALLEDVCDPRFPTEFANDLCDLHHVARRCQPIWTTRLESRPACSRELPVIERHRDDGADASQHVAIRDPDQPLQAFAPDRLCPGRVRVDTVREFRHMEVLELPVVQRGLPLDCETLPCRRRREIPGHGYRVRPGVRSAFIEVRRNRRLDRVRVVSRPSAHGPSAFCPQSRAARRSSGFLGGNDPLFFW